MAPEAVDAKARCPDPPLWALEHPAQPGLTAVGVAGEAGALAVLLTSLQPAAVPIPTVYGTMGIDLGLFFELAGGAQGPAGLLEHSRPPRARRERLHGLRPGVLRLAARRDADTHRRVGPSLTGPGGVRRASRPRDRSIKGRAALFPPSGPR